MDAGGSVDHAGCHPDENDDEDALFCDDLPDAQGEGEEEGNEEDEEDEEEKGRESRGDLSFDVEGPECRHIGKGPVLPPAEYAKLMQRVVVHIDMDCFYVQVEQNRNPTLWGKPCAVVQYNNWKGGAIIAVGYEARKFGVKRNMRGLDAKQLCPDINLVQVEVANGKADLSKYRKASKEIFGVLCSVPSRQVERLSIDEAFVDITEEVEREVREFTDCAPREVPPRTVVWGVRNIGDHLGKLDNDQRHAELRLLAAAHVAARIRKKVWEDLKYTCSAGISINKVLAKLATAYNKPDGQTVFLPSMIPALWRMTPLEKLRSLGGKLGKELKAEMGIDWVVDLQRYSLQQLVSRYGTRIGEWLHLIGYGVSREEVKRREIPMAIGCSKTFTPPLTEQDQVRHWIKELSKEVAERVQEDSEENRRTPGTLTVGCSNHRSFTSRARSFAGPPPTTPEDIALEGYRLFQKAWRVAAKPGLKVTALSMSFNNFSSDKGGRTGSILALLRPCKPTDVPDVVEVPPPKSSPAPEPPPAKRPKKEGDKTVLDRWLKKKPKATAKEVEYIELSD